MRKLHSWAQRCRGPPLTRMGCCAASGSLCEEPVSIPRGVPSGTAPAAPEVQLSVCGGPPGSPAGVGLAVRRGFLWVPLHRPGGDGPADPPAPRGRGREDGGAGGCTLRLGDRGSSLLLELYKNSLKRALEATERVLKVNVKPCSRRAGATVVGQGTHGQDTAVNVKRRRNPNAQCSPTLK